LPATIANVYVRPATTSDIAYIADLSARVQAKLTASGSLQQIGHIPIVQVAAQVAARTASLLIEGDKLRGSVFVEPMTEQILPDIPRPPQAASGTPLWFLQKLMIEPQLQGRGLGNLLLDAAKEVVATQGGILLLDCWAGNTKLRAFYTNAGFKLYGVFPVRDFEIAIFTWST
jgi:GNAT superfamily N-acetyltransferase